MMIGTVTVRALGLVLVLLASGADAAPRICKDLEAELAQAGHGGSALARRYDQAIIQQRQQLSRIDRQAERLGCGSYGGDDRCYALDDKIAEMEDNLDTLMRTRRRMAGSGDPDRAVRRRLLARIEAYGCRDSGLDQPDGRNGLARVEPSPQATPQEDGSGGPQAEPRESQPALVPAGPKPAPVAETFRTMCVRTCDGYFFPMSYAAGATDFDRDETACQSACPGTEVKLYTYRTSDQNPENMVSATDNAPYRALPSAFHYRDPGAEKVVGCSCAAKQKNFSVIAGETKPDAPTEAAPRPDPAVVPGAVAQSSPGAAPAGDAPAAGGEDRKVRAVGPAFLPDPKAAIDLKAPARN